MGKTHRKHQHTPQTARSRTTRSHKPRLLSDPASSSAHLDSQLRALGLYPANTLGDGNCLFRALSDQLYGSPSKHGALRQAICDYIAAHKARYAPFCEDERGLDVHVRCMRENGTYGGHLELSSFAHMVKRDVKVVQPGLVYVIEWAAGMEEGEREEELRVRREEEEREVVREGLVGGLCEGTIYVAYHDWEHFSSIRNLNGPHGGLPNVVEAPPVEDYYGQQMEEKRDPKKEREKQRKERDKARRITKVKLKLSAPPSAASTPPPPMVVDPPTPSSTMDSLSSLTSLASTSTSSSAPSSSSTAIPPPTLPPPTNPTNATAALSPPAFRVHRSPKRSFDESTSSEDGQSVVSGGSDDVVERGRRGQEKRSRMGSSVLREEAATATVTVAVESSCSSVAGAGAGTGGGGGACGDAGKEGGESEDESEGDDEAESSDDDDDEEGDGDCEDEDEDDDDEEQEVVAAIAVPSPSPSPPTSALAGAAAGISASASATGTGNGNGTLTTSMLDPSEAQAILDEGYSSLSELESDYSDSGPPAPAAPSSLGSSKDRAQMVKGKANAKGKGNGKEKAKEKRVHHLDEDGNALTRRQRKALGLPKFRGTTTTTTAGSAGSAGKIVIPGGRFKGRLPLPLAVSGTGGGEGESQGEWVKSGVGRVDVRGFRELKI